jgi:hypothetical protein
MIASPYGFWKSPITSDLVVADSIRLEQAALDGDAIYWTETQPQKQGRTFVYRIGADGEPERVTLAFASDPISRCQRPPRPSWDKAGTFSRHWSKSAQRNS